jgi:hypothetical protein
MEILPSTKQYMFKDLKFYATTQWFYNPLKHYNTVFEKAAINYLYAELSFQNKLFNQKTWKAKICFKVYQIALHYRNLITEIIYECEVPIEDAMY